MLDLGVVGVLQSLLSNQLNEVLHGLLYLPEWKLRQPSVLLAKGTPRHLILILIADVKDFCLLPQVLEEGVQKVSYVLVRLDLALSLGGGLLLGKINLVESHEGLGKVLHAKVPITHLTLDTKTEDVVAASIEEISELVDLGAIDHDQLQQLAVVLQLLLVGHQFAQVVDEVARMDHKLFEDDHHLFVKDVLATPVDLVLDVVEGKEGIPGGLEDLILFDFEQEWVFIVAGK